MSGTLQILLLVLAAATIFVNGFTDAPNAITCAVSTGAMPYRKAVRMAAVCNLLGIVVMSLVSSSVADTVTSLVRLDPDRPGQWTAVLCAAMASVAIFAAVAWYFGIPTSESHALIAGLTGAALALGDPSAINPAAWGKVLIGLGMSLAMGFALGFGATALLGPSLKRMGSRVADVVQIAAAGGMAFMHGAQDGQKFFAVLVMASAPGGGLFRGGMKGSLPVLLFVAALMSLGTLAGGKRIITHVGSEMTALEKSQGACADIGGILCLLPASLWGLPMSTTHTKTAAILGAGLSAGRSRVNGRVVRDILTAWLITFPVCGMLGYLLAGLITRVAASY